MNEYNKLSHTNVLNKNEFNLKIQDINEIYETINKTNIIFNKIDVIIDEWFKYHILNNSNYAINQINSLLPECFDLINDVKYTTTIYYNIGNLIFNNITLIIYIIGLLLISIFIMQIIMCILLCIIYKKK